MNQSLEITTTPDSAMSVHEPSQGNPLDMEPAQFSSGLARRKTNRKALMDWVRESLVEGTDYGSVPTKRGPSKPSLWKPGAEKICGMLGVNVRFPSFPDYEQAALTGTEIKNIILRCQIVTANGAVVAEGVGSRSLEQDYGDLNKALKMASKSAHIDATLRMAGLSEVFTQDLENMTQEPKPAPQPTARPSEPGMGQPQAGQGSSGPKNYVVRPAPTAEDWKLSFLKLSKERKMEYWAWKWALDHGLLPTEPLRDIPADLVPTTRSGQVQLVDGFKALMDEAIKVGGPDPEDVEAFYKANEEDQIPGLEVKKESALPDSRPRVEGEIAYVSVKSGKKKNGDPWTSYGIKINDKYYNTFSNTLGQKAAALKEQVVTLIYTEEERGNKAQALIWNGETTNAGES